MSLARTRRAHPDWRKAFALALLAMTSACRSLDRFDSKPGTAYCGAMVSAGFVRGGLLPANARPSLGMRLTLDTSKLDTTPGVVSTDDFVRGLCAPLPLFQEAPLRAIPQVANDELSLLEFGNGRELNFFAWVDSTCTETVLAVVSLMKDDSVEVRLLKPAPENTASPAEGPGFGIFRLRQQRGTCGF